MLTKELIDKFYEDVKALGLKFPVATIAKETGYSKGNVSAYLKGSAPSQNFINAFYKKFSNSIKKVPRENSPLTLQEPEPGYKAGQPEKYLSLMEERVKELKEDKEWLKKQIEVNLNSLAYGQKSILSHVSVILDKDCEQEADGDKRKEKRLKDDVDKRATAKMLGTQQTDSVNNR